MFWKKANDSMQNALYSLEYEKCLKRFAELNTDIEILKAKYKMLETNHDNLRGKFSQRLKGLAIEEKKEEEVKIDNIIKDEYVGIG